MEKKNESMAKKGIFCASVYGKYPNMTAVLFISILVFFIFIAGIAVGRKVERSNDYTKLMQSGLKGRDFVEGHRIERMEAINKRKYQERIMNSNLDATTSPITE